MDRQERAILELHEQMETQEREYAQEVEQVRPLLYPTHVYVAFRLSP